MTTSDHLLYELKRDLDAAVAALQDIEQQVMDLEVAYNARLPGLADAEAKALMAEKEAREEELDLGGAFARQQRASARFSLLSSVYEVACAAAERETIYEALPRQLFRSADDVTGRPEVLDTLARLADALHAYFRESLNDANDKRIRAAWAEVEEVLRSVGRRI